MESTRLEPGAILAGKYRIQRLLGQGGMGMVVEAFHLQLQEPVALKLLLPGAHTAETAARFLREAQAAAKIKGEHVVRVLDVGQLPEGHLFLVMELLDGQDLSQRLQQGALPVREAVDSVLQACEALAQAHEAGIVHRDLKPANLFLTRTPDGAPLVKVLDFGISKLSGAASPEIASLTRTSAVMGSPLYMSPEQIRSAKYVDLRTDIWALGVILYESISASTPFLADTVQGLLASIIADPPRPLSTVVSGLPPGLDAVVMRCLEKSPELRPASVGELARALAPFASDAGRASAERVERISARRPSIPGVDPILAPPEAQTARAWTQTAPAVQPPARRRAPLLLLGAVLAAGGAAGLFFHTSAAPPERVAAPPVASPAPVLTSEPDPPASTSAPAGSSPAPPVSSAEGPPAPRFTPGASPAKPPARARVVAPLAPPGAPAPPAPLPGLDGRR